MPQVFRREAISDSSIATSGIGRRSFQRMDSGTRAMGGAAGTVTFRHGPFLGTPTVLLQELRGSTSLGNPRRVIVVSRFSGSFTWAGTPRHGTFQWFAVGSAQ